MPFPYGFPVSSDYNQLLEVLQHQNTLANANANTNKLSTEITGVAKDIYDASDKVAGLTAAQALGLRDAIERNFSAGQSTAERNNIAIQTSAERIGANNLIATERNGAVNNSTTERIGGALQVTTERIGATNQNAIERTSGLTQSTLERIAGEGRLTTTVTDAASRQFAADQARDLSVAIERNGANNFGVTERTAGQTQAALERIVGEGRLTTTVTDAASRQFAADQARDLSVAIERNGANNFGTTERTAGLTQSMMERIAGEGRLTTTVTDAASRQAAADQARDLAIAIERNGSNGITNTDKISSILMGAINNNAGIVERTAAENRMTTVTTDAASRQALHDVRRDVISQVDKGTNELANAVITNGYETRINTTHHTVDLKNQLATGFSASQLLAANNTSDLSNLIGKESYNAMLNLHNLHEKQAAQSARDYASTVLEQQKSKEHILSKGDTNYASTIIEANRNKEMLAAQASNHFAVSQLEQQKAKEEILSKVDTNYASTIIEANRNKEMLASQAANHFAITQLEQQKIKESLSAQMADAKYEALKNKEALSMQIAECCCEVKTTVRALDENRVRDALNVERNEVNLLKVFDRSGSRRRSPSRDRERSYNINNTYIDDDYRGRGRGRRDDREDDDRRRN